MLKDRWIPHLSSLPPPRPSFTPHSPRLKASCFQRKRFYTKGKRAKKIIHLFVFFLRTAAVSHAASPIHTLTPSEPLPYPNLLQNNTPLPPPHYPPPHTPCPPGCLSSGLCGINELIHTVLSSSIPLLHGPM